MSLENFLTSQTQAPDWFTNVDPTDTILQEILRKGYIFKLIETHCIGGNLIHTTETL